MSDDEPDEFGTRQAPLVVRISKILSDYPPGAQILKELIQNADDAKANRVAFLVDPRKHSVKDLMNPELARFQGPALVAWNNAKFEKDDWENIGRLDQSSKEAEVLKVGRFGIGFQSIHHITDVPFIVSGKRVGILDPHTVFISNKDEGETGKTIKLSEFSKFADQVAPFIGHFGFDHSTKNYDATLFRFPFRRNDGMFHSKISDKCYTGDEIIADLYSSLMEEASHILLFLKCIESIELYTWDPTVNAPKLYLQIELEPACVSRVRELRRMCKDHCDDVVSFTAMGAFSVQVTDSIGQKQSFSWLTCNTVGSSDGKVLSLASKLQVLPWVGIAASLPSAAQCQNCFFEDLVRPGITSEDIAQGLLHQRKCFKSVENNWKVVKEQDEGFAFCFLPLKDPTGLPVSIHGYFRVASNRRSIEWPNANNTGESALWNRHLIEALVVPSYAILLASKQYLLSYIDTPALPPAEGVPNPYSWLPMPHEVKHSEIWRHLLQAETSVQSLLTTSPVCWTAADGGKWVTPNEAYLVNDTVPKEVSKLLIVLNCPVVSLPPAIKECFCYGETEYPFQYVDQHYVRNQLKKNAAASAQLLKDAVLCLKVLEYITADLSSSGYSCLEGLPIVPLAQPGSEPVCLQRKQAVTSHDLVYIITDDLTRSILPGLDSKLLSHKLPEHIQDVFLSLADTDQFCVIKATPHIVCPGLIEESMITWNAQPGQHVLWSPRSDTKGDMELTDYAHNLPTMPEEKWLNNLWEWVRSKLGVSLEYVKHLPIVPMAPVSGSVHEQVQLCTLNALGMSLRQPVTAVSQQIAKIVEELGCTLVPHSHIFIGHEDTLNVYLPTVSPLSLLQALKDIRNASLLVKNLSTGTKDVLRCYLLGSIAEMESGELAFLRSLPVFKTRASEYVTLQNLASIVFPPNNIELLEGVRFPTNTLHISPKDYEEYRMLLGTEPETLDSFIASHAGPFAICECTVSERNKVFLWALRQLRASQDATSRTPLCGYLKKTEFLPSNCGDHLYCPQALYDPEDEFLKQMFLDSEAAFPSLEFHSYLAELKELGLQTKHELQRNGRAFQSFIIDRAHAVIRFDSAKANQCSKHILKALCDADRSRSLSKLVFDEVRDIPFLFCQSTLPKGYPPGLGWAGAARDVRLPPSSLCASQDQQHLSHLVGSVSPVLSHRYKKVYNEQVFKSLFLDVSVDMVCQHLANVVELDSQALSDNAAIVTEMMESVYPFLNQHAGQNVNPLAPRCIWNESRKTFLPLEKVAWTGIPGSSLVPYRYTIQEIPGAYRYQQLWREFQVQETFEPHAVQQVLRELQGHLQTDEKTLSDTEVSMVIQILKLLQNKGITDQVLMPTVKGTLLRAEDCTYDDRELTSERQKLLDNKGFMFTHSDVSKDLAQHFNVPPVTSKIAKPTGLKIKCEKAGQSIELTRRIGNIIKDYEDSIDVFKELIQNADDAGATEVRFLIDWRKHDLELLFTKEMRHWQGPALYAYNNSVFSEDDFENIRQVEAGTKLKDPTKIGRFGLGFCSVYQLTDLPSFLSSSKLVVFDPHMHFLGASLTSGSPGISIDFVEQQGDIGTFYRDQVLPYQGVFGCKVLDVPGKGKLEEREFQGTLFRFPFRGMRTPRSDICSKTFDRKEIRQWKEDFKQSAQNLLVFLRHVKMVGLYELESGGNPTKDMKEVCIISCENETDLFTPCDLVEEYHRDPEGVRGSCSLALKSVSVDEPVMTKKGEVMTEKHEQKWLVASAVGREDSFKFARSSYGIAHGLVPLAEVAVKMDGEKSLTPKACEGQLFCFLPLPIACDVKFLINGFFDVSTNRRSLKDLQDRSKKDVWNHHLITDCLSRAVLWMFGGLQQCCPIESLSPAFLKLYYKLFPTDDATDDVSKELKPALLKRLQNDNNPFFHVMSSSGQCWKNCHEAHILHQDFHTEHLSETFPDMLQVMTEIVGLSIAANVPEKVQDVLRNLLHIVSPRQYYRELFIPRLPAIESCCRERQMIFVLKNIAQIDGKDRWLEELLKKSQCIPTVPIGTLVQPTRLVDPSGPLQVLFEECEERFPVPQLRSDEIPNALRTLGMCHDILNVEDVVERAQSVVNLSAIDLEKAHNRSRKLLVYISEHNRDVPSLSTIPFLPAMKRPEGVRVPWMASDTGVEFSSASKMYNRGFKLVFSTGLILDPNLWGLQHLEHLHIPSNVLKFQPKPTLEQVTQHLKSLSKWAGGSTLSKRDQSFLTDTTAEVYTFLENNLKEADDTSVGRRIVQNLELDQDAVVWNENTGVFLKVDLLALQPLENMSLAPYRLSADEVLALKRSPRLWKTLGICEMFSTDDCIAVLHEMPTQLTKQDVNITANILRYLAESGETEVRQRMLVPTTKQTLLPPSKCYYNDFPWKQQAQGRHLLDKYDFVDTNSVPPNMAQKFGVRPISAIIANPTRLKIRYEEKGQHIPLTRRINRLLEEYSEIDDVFKELIQNADDAEASVIKFLIDWRQHKTEYLLKPEMAPAQGPALYVYNDKTFSDQDFDNICELEGATKRRNPTKIGRFGVGFCAAYHLTDVPSFVSRSQLVILDPLTKFLTDATAASSPGIRFDFVEEQEELASFYADQMAPYQGVFGCNVLGAQEGFDGTLFRFPFRSEASEISKGVIQRDQIGQLKQVLMRHAEKLLIFLQHLKKVELYELCEGQDSTRPSLLVSLERDSSRSVNLLEQFKNAVEHDGRMTHYSNTCTQEYTLTRTVVVPGKSPKSKKKKGRSVASLQSYSTKWLVASAVGEVGSSSWEHACSVEGRERGDVPVAEVAVPVVTEDGVLPELLQTGQVFCFLPLPITISDQKCLINGYFEISKNRRDLAKLQDEEEENAWNRLLIRDVLVKACIALLKHLSDLLPCDKNQHAHFLEWYYKLWPVAAASHPLSKELQVAFKKALCEADVPLVWSLADGGKWLPVCQATCMDYSFHMSLFDTVRMDILDILVQHERNMAELPYTVRVSLSVEPDSCLATVSFRHYCEEVLLKNLQSLPHDLRDAQLLFILKHLGALNDAEGDGWLVKLLTSTACIPCEPNGTLICPSKLVFPEGLLHELYDVDEERFPSKVFSEVKQSLVELGMAVHKLKEDDVLERAELMHALPIDRSRQRCESFMQYLTTVHFVSEVKEAPRKWREHMKNPLIEALSDIAFLPIQQRPEGSTIPWCGDCTLFASPKEVYSQSGSDLIFSYKLIADLPRGHDMVKLFLFKSPTSEEILSHITLIVKWSEADETMMTPQDQALLDRCMPAMYEKLSDSFGYSKREVIPNADARSQGTSMSRAGTYAGISESTTTMAASGNTVDASSQELNSLWKEKGLQDKPFIWQECNAVKRFHTSAQTVSDSCLKQSCYPYLVKLSPEYEQYQQFFKALGVKTTLTRQKIADVLKSIARDWKEAQINDQELLEFIVHVAQQHLHYHHDNKLVFYLPDDKGVMRDAREMTYPESITESDFVPEDLVHGLTHFVSNRIPKAAAKRLGVRDILANIMRHFEDNDYYKEEDFGQKEEICTRLNNILSQYPADVSIFKEFIQNAEDAMATEIAFVIDHRQSYGDKSMFAQHSSWKSLQTMPALLVVNNRKFRETDIQNIKKLGTGGKADASDKIGRFGVGFNVAYHVTDCPTLVSFGEGGLAENFCVFDPQFKYVPNRFGGRLPGARYKMKNVDGKNSSEHFPDQFAPFLRDVMQHMAKSAPGSFADLEAKWPHGYSVFRLPLTRAARRPKMYESYSKSEATKSQELLGYPMTLLRLKQLAKGLTEQAPGMLLFLNHLKRISVFEVSNEGGVLSPWTVEVRHNLDSQKQCSQFATDVKCACASMKGDGGSQLGTHLENYHITYSIHLKTTTATPERSDSMDSSAIQADEDPTVQSPQVPHKTTLLSLNCTAASITREKASTSAAKVMEEHKRELGDDSSKEVLVTQQTDSTWVISKRFGLCDIPEELLYTGSKEQLFPLAGVAIPLPDASGTYNGSTFTGSLYCHLPLPLNTGIPAHINGHFWVDPSRKHLEGSLGTGRKGTLLDQWNEAITQEVVSRAYVNAVTHCKEFVKNSRASCDWFNSLLLAHPTPSSVLDDFLFSKNVYQLMIEGECKVLIGDALATEDVTDMEWLALTTNIENPLKGWFFVGHPEVRRVLLSIGVKLVSTPLTVNTRASLITFNSKVQGYSGEATVDLARKYLKEIATCYEDYQDVIVSALVPLLTYVLSGIDSPDKCSPVNGLPLILTKNNQLRLIATGFPLHSLEHTDLLPERCQGKFVSPLLMESSELKDKLLKLHLVTPISPKYLAENIDLPNKPVVAFEGCNMELLRRLWEYIAISISSNPEILKNFQSVSIIPTSRSTVVSVRNCKTVLREYGSMTLLRKLQLPVLNFVSICTASSTTKYNIVGCVKEMLAKESEMPEVLYVLQHQLAFNPETAIIANVTEDDVNEFIGFLLKDTRTLHSYTEPLKKLNLLKVMAGEWESLQNLGAVYALPREATPEVGLLDIHLNSNVKIIEINHQHSAFYELMGVQVLNRLDFYTHVIIPYFQLMRLQAQIAHLKHMRVVDELKALLPKLHSIRFIKDDRRHELQLASEYCDPGVEVMKEFLPDGKFPPEMWCEPGNLEILRLLNLNSTVTDDMWINFAHQVRGCEKNSLEKADLLLESLRIRVQTVFAASDVETDGLQETPEQLLQFLHNIADIKFVPHQFPANVELLFRQLGISIPVPPCRFVCFRRSLFCREEDVVITTLIHEHPQVIIGKLLPASLIYHPSQRKIVDQVVSALGMQLPSVLLVCQNLLRLTSYADQCNLSSRHENKNAVERLQQLFTCHYDYFAGIHDELNEISIHLNGKKCLFISSDLSFMIVKGSSLAKATTVHRPYSKYLSCVPRYLTLPKYWMFLTAVGVREAISAKHFVYILEALYNSSKKTDPNFIEVISSLYKDLVRLLEGPEREDAELYITDNGKPIPLPSTNGELLPADQLVLNDAEWLKERLEQCSDYHFIMPPPSSSSGKVSLPPCLGVQPLSELIFEELDEAAVLDRDNRCEAELRAEATAPVVDDEEERGDELVESCPYSSQFVTFIQSEEFGNGLRRMISHQLGGKPLSMEHEQAIEAVQSLGVKCVYAIRTHLRHKHSGRIPDTQSDDVPCFLDEKSDAKCLYVCFHPKNEHDSNLRLLAMVVGYIARMLDGSVNAMHLREIFESCDPTAVEGVLDVNRVTTYKVQDETDDGMLQYQEGRGTAVENDLELMLTCNFREGDLVKYCSEDSRMVISRVMKVESENSVAENYPFPPTVILKLSPRSDGQLEKKIMNSLLVCKFLSPQQITHLESLRAVQDDSEELNSSTELSQEKDVLLELPCNDRIDLQHYFTGISDGLHQFESMQRLFAIERLLFQLHFDCVHRNRQPASFPELVEVLRTIFVIHCTDETFIQSLESKISSLLQPLVQPAPTVRPDDVTVYQRQDSYTELSSWSIPTVPSASNATGRHAGGSTYRGQYISPTPPPAPYLSSRRRRGRGRRSHYPVSPAPGRLRGGGAYIWGGGMGRGAQHSIWPEVTEDVIPILAPTVSLEDAFIWLKDACRTVQLVKDLEDVEEVINVPTLEGEELESVYKYPEALCFYAHEIVLKCLKAVFFAYCGLPNQLVECSNLAQLHQTLMGKLEGNREVLSILGETARSYVHLVSGHGDCCRFPTYDPKAMPCDTHSPAVAREVMRSAMCFVKEIQKLNEIRAFFPEGLEPFTVVRPDNWTVQEGEFPSRWERHGEDEELKIIPLNPHSLEFKEIAALFTNTMPSDRYTIERLERIQNRVLWMRYRDCKERLRRDLPSAGEKHLFHGTRQTDPAVIYGGDAGFDVGHSNIGMWGPGNYFAVNASYSHHYAHTRNVIGHPAPLSKMLVAKVLSGLPFVSPPRSELRFPPERADTGVAEGRVRRRYNSVQGTTGGSEVYITYTNEQAYPAYVISYISH